MDLFSHLLHYSLHFVFPFFLARWINPSEWRKVGLVMLGTMIIDVDHLLANPIFDPHRCSLGFHPLHGWIAAGLYLTLCFFPRPWLWIGIGCICHLLTDGINCWMLHLE